MEDGSTSNHHTNGIYMNLLEALSKAQLEAEELSNKSLFIIGVTIIGHSLQTFIIDYSEEDSEPWFSVDHFEGTFGSYSAEGETIGSDTIESLIMNVNQQFPAISGLNFFLHPENLSECTPDHILHSLFDHLPNYDACFDQKPAEYLRINKEYINALNNQSGGI
jgi:hypothetical protein